MISAHGLCAAIAVELIVAGERAAREEDAPSRAVVAVFVAVPNRSASVAVSSIPLVGTVAMATINAIAPDTVSVAFAIHRDSAQFVAVGIRAVVEAISTGSAIQRLVEFRRTHAARFLSRNHTTCILFVLPLIAASAAAVLALERAGGWSAVEVAIGGVAIAFAIEATETVSAVAAVLLIVVWRTCLAVLAFPHDGH